MKVASVEGAAHDIRVNAVSPFARTRMSAEMLAGHPEADELDPSRVAPMVVYLASELARDVTGRVLRVEGRRIGSVHFQRGPVREGDWTPEGIASALHALLEH
jgi:NAD(P)-dependent dehydrogenase (short-subunit alcohol dehydrogenase family)